MARKNRPIKGGKNTISIIVDGETEVWYLQLLRDEEDLGDLTIKPDLPQKTGVEEQFEMVREHARIYNQVVWLLDLDTVLKENREAKGSFSVFRKLDGFLSEAAAMENVRVLVNTPCLEFWFLLHEKQVGRFYDKCTPVEGLLKKSSLLPGYEKTQKYFKNSRTNVYRRLKPHLEKAISNARALGSFDIKNPEAAKAETFILFEILGIGKEG